MFTYNQIHRQLVAQRGRAATYECPCGAAAQEWAYQKGQDGSKFSQNLDDYTAMCKSCHRHLDRESYVLNGQKTLLESLSRAGRIHATAMASIKRKCSGCEMVSHPVGIGRHQKASGHTGWTEAAA